MKTNINNNAAYVCEQKNAEMALCDIRNTISDIICVCAYLRDKGMFSEASTLYSAAVLYESNLIRTGKDTDNKQLSAGRRQAEEDFRRILSSLAHSQLYDEQCLLYICIVKLCAMTEALRAVYAE